MTSDTMGRSQTPKGIRPNLQSAFKVKPLPETAPAPIPLSLTIDNRFYQNFMQRNRLHEVLAGLLTVADVKDLEAIEGVARQMRQIIKSAPAPSEVTRHIQECHQKLGGRRVAMWPITSYYVSIYARDEQGEPFSLKARGIDSIVQGVKRCWSILFEARCIFYRELNDIKHEDAWITVALQAA